MPKTNSTGKCNVRITQWNGRSHSASIFFFCGTMAPTVDSPTNNEKLFGEYSSENNALTPIHSPNVVRIWIEIQTTIVSMN